jgi:outer membrane protein OmpA-like peptidoglycan-associated protein/tetratricopeptide (TPR) repeat protein
MKSYIIFGLSLLFALTAVAQDKDNEKLFYEAEEYLELENWGKAFELYSKILEKESDNANINFKAGYCLLNNDEAEKAIPYLEKAMKNIDEEGKADDSYENKKAPLETYYFLGKAYHRAYKFEESLFVLSKLRSKLNPNDDKDFIRDIDYLMRCDSVGSELVKHHVKMIVKNLGDSINTEYTEHSPVFTADESVLFFTSRRPNNHKILSDGQYDEDIYYSYSDDDGNWGKAKNVGDIINTEEHDATVSISIDGSELYIYRDDDKGSIYVSKLDDKNNWTKHEKLPYPINTKYRETHASLGADNMTLYFTSDRPGGYGGLDIYVVRRLPNGKWGIPQNLGPAINTPYDEEGPFIHPDGKTLFFSSKGHNTMGGYDIFYSSYNEETKTWSTPQNLGYPINTTADDVFYVPTPDGKRAYYASKQFNSLGRTDIFLITLPGLEEKGLTVLSGYIVTAQGNVPDDVSITVTDVKTGDVEGVYTPNPTTGKYLFILRPGKDYNVAVEASGFSYFSENISVPKGSSYKKIKKVIKLNPIILGDIEDEYYVKFNLDDATLIPGIKRELDNMYKFMKVNDTLKLNVMLSDESKKDSEINKKRKLAIKDYLVSKGIDANRIFTDKKVSGGVSLIILNNDDESVASNKNSETELQHKYANYVLGVSESNVLSEGQKGKLDDFVGKEGNMVYYNIVSENKEYANNIKNYLIKSGVSENAISISSSPDSASVNIIANKNEVASITNNNGKDLTAEVKKTIDDLYNCYSKNETYNIISSDNTIRNKIKDYLMSKGVPAENIKFSDKEAPEYVNIIVKQSLPNAPVVLEFTRGETKLSPKHKEILDELTNKYKGIPFFVEDNNNKRYDNVKSYLLSKGAKISKNKIGALTIKVEEIEKWSEDPLKDYSTTTSEVKVRAILFDFDKWQTEKFDDVLYNLFNYMKNNPDAVIAIYGHTDVQGSAEYNLILSRKRAEFVKDYLVRKGINPGALVIKPHGEENPVSINLNPETRKYNRRVEFEVIKQGEKQKLICIPVQVPEEYRIKKHK